MRNLLLSPAFQQAWQALSAHDVLASAVKIQQISAPTFAEQQRAEWVSGAFRALGVADVRLDSQANVLAWLTPPNSLRRPFTVVSAHTDTVFDHASDLSLQHSVGRIQGAGIGDNSLGVAALLSLASGLLGMKEPLPGSVLLLANTCEEGLGDLRGMRTALLGLPIPPDQVIVLEGSTFGALIHRGVGVRRFKISVETAGGHSWSDYGAPSAVHELARIAQKILQIPVSSRPRASLNIGQINGGSGINVIASTAHLTLDLRCEEEPTLARMVRTLTTILEHATRPQVQVTLTAIGNRPAGNLPTSHPLVRSAVQALQASGVSKPQLLSASTDANYPLSLGIPAICLGITRGGNAHRMDEYIETADIPNGLRQLLLVVFACQLAGS